MCLLAFCVVFCFNNSMVDIVRTELAGTSSNIIGNSKIIFFNYSVSEHMVSKVISSTSSVLYSNYISLTISPLYINTCTTTNDNYKPFVPSNLGRLYESKWELCRIECIDYPYLLILIEQHFFIKSFSIHIFTYHLRPYFLQSPIHFFLTCPTVINFTCRAGTSVRLLYMSKPL